MPGEPSPSGAGWKEKNRLDAPSARCWRSQVNGEEGDTQTDSQTTPRTRWPVEALAEAMACKVDLFEHGWKIGDGWWID